MSKEHTPTPWSCQRAESVNEFDIVAPFPELPEEPLFIATTMDMEPHHGGGKANAEFIVRAVNCHDDLVAALTWAMSQVRPYSKRIKGQNEAWCDAYDAATAALSKSQQSVSEPGA